MAISMGFMRFPQAEVRGEEPECMVVKRGDWLIEQPQLAPGEHQARQCDSPALALRELAHGRGGKLAEFERFQCGPDAKRLGCRIAQPGQLLGQTQALCHSQIRVDAVGVPHIAERIEQGGIAAAHGYAVPCQ
jgi:hypothetical protein